MGRAGALKMEAQGAQNDLPKRQNDSLKLQDGAHECQDGPSQRPNGCADGPWQPNLLLKVLSEANLRATGSLRS